MDLFTEVIIVDMRHAIRQRDEFQIVGRDDADAMPTRESTNVGLTANEALPIVCTAENFVDQEAQGKALKGLRPRSGAKGCVGRMWNGPPETLRRHRGPFRSVCRATGLRRGECA